MDATEAVPWPWSRDTEPFSFRSGRKLMEAVRPLTAHRTSSEPEAPQNNNRVWVLGFMAHGLCECRRKCHMQPMHMLCPTERAHECHPLRKQGRCIAITAIIAIPCHRLSSASINPSHDFLLGRIHRPHLSGWGGTWRQGAPPAVDQAVLESSPPRAPSALPRRCKPNPPAKM